MSVKDLYRVVLGATLDKGAGKNIQKEIKKVTESLKPIELRLDIKKSDLKKLQSLPTSINAINKGLDDIVKKQKAYNNAVKQTATNVKKVSDIQASQIDSSIRKQITSIQDFSRKNTTNIANADLTKDFEQLIKQLNGISRYSPAARADIQALSATFGELKLKVNETTDAVGKVTKDTAFQVQMFQEKMNLNLDKLTASLGKKANTKAIEDFRQSINALDPSMDNIDKRMKEMQHSYNELNFQQKEAANYAGFFGDALNNVGKRIVSYVGVVLSTRAMMAAVRGGVQTIQEIDGSLTEVAMVTGQTREQVKGLGKEFNTLAKDMSVSTSAITEGAVTFYRQGLDNEQVLERLRAATVYSKVANMDFNDSVEIITASVNSMGIEAEKVVDVLVYLGDATATSGEEVGKGFARTSGSAKAMGLEFEKVASWIATISAKTREDAGSIGSAINTIITRMANIKAKGFDEEDGTQINEVAKALEKVNIQLMDIDTGEWNDFGAIMDELGRKWDTLDGKTKSYIATTMAGTRRQSQFFNLMEGYADSVELYEGALDAAGTASEKFDTYLESNAAKADKFKATVEGLWINLIDSDALGNVIDMGTKGITILEAFITAIAEIDKGLLKLFGTALLFKGLLTGLAKFAAVEGIAEMGILQLVKTLAVSHPLLLGVTAAVGGLAYVFGKNALATKEQEEALGKLNDTVANTTSQVAGLDKTISKFKELEKSAKTDAKAREELLDLQRELARTYPELVDAMDDEGNKLVTNTELLEQYRDAKKDSMMQDLEAANELASKQLPELDNQLREVRDRIAEIDRLQASGATKVTEQVVDPTSGAILMEYERDIAKELADEKRELIDTEIKLTAEKKQSESVMELYNTQLEKEAEAAKWARAEAIESAFQHATTAEEVRALTKELKELGFTSEEVAKIRKGALAEVKAATEVLTEAEKAEIWTLNELDATSKSTIQTRLANEARMTKELIKQIQARIKAIQAEAQAMAALTGSKSMVMDNPLMNVQKPGAFERATGVASMSEMLIKQKNAETKELAKQKLDLEKQLREINDLSNFVTNLPTPSAGNIYTAGGGGGKDKKKKKGKEEYRALYDMYMEINKLIDDNTNALSRNATMQSLNDAKLKDSAKLVKEELELRRERQELLHSQAQLMRSEKTQLEKALSQQGFTFTGEGDKRFISNLQNITGKTKEVEEAVKRYIDLTTKEIPAASNEWLELEATITKLKIDKITSQFYQMTLAIEENARKSNELNHELTMLGENDANRRIELVGEQHSIAATNAERYRLQLEILDTLQADDKNSRAYLETREEIAESFRKAKEEAKKYAEQIEDIKEKERTRYMQEQNKIYDEQQEKLKALEQMQERIVAIIKKRGEEEKRILDENHKKDMEQLKERHDERKENYKDELDAYKKMIQDKIDALDEQYEEEDYQEKLNEEKQKAIELQERLNILSLDDSLEGRNQALKVREELAKQQNKIDKMQSDRERKKYKESLQDRLKDKEDELKDKEDLSNDFYENEKAKLEEDYKINKEALDKKYSDAEVYKEAREALISGYVQTVDGSFVDIYTAYVEFEDKFGKGMGILGDIIKEDFVAELDKATEAIDRFFEKSEELVKRIQSTDEVTDEQAGLNDFDLPPTGLKRHPDFNNWNDEDYAEYVNNKAMWENATPDERATFAMRNALLRKKYGMKADKHSLKDLIAHYDTGGFIPRDGMIMAHEAELYVPPKEQQALWTFLQSLPKMLTGNMALSKSAPIGATGGGDVYEFNFTGVDESLIPRFKGLVREALEEKDGRAVRNLKKRGV